MNKAYLLAITAVVAVVAAVAYLAATSGGGPKAAAVMGAVPEWAMRVGPPGARAVLIEFFDPLCPYCAVAHYRAGGDIERLVEEGRLQLVLIPLPLHGNISLAIINDLYCAYQSGGDVLRMLNAWYKAYVDYAVNKTEEEVVSAYKALESYKCNNTLTLDQFAFALQSFSNAGVAISGTPTFIVVRGNDVEVIVGARVDLLKSALERAAR